MAADLLLAILRANLAIAAAVLLAALLRRPVRALFGAEAAYALWGLVPAAALAAVLPARVITGEAIGKAAALPAPALDAAAPMAASAARAAESAAPAMPLLNAADVAVIALVLWALVAGLWLAIQLIRQRRYLAALGRLSPVEGPAKDLWRTARGDLGPALVGALRPRVVLPADFADRFSPEQQAVVIAHERAHRAAGHAQANFALALMQALCWFNPLIHLGAALFRADQELACDAAVIARHPDARRAYAEAMLAIQLAPAVPLGCHWAPRSALRLKQRIALLKRATPGRLRRLAGAALAAVLTLGAGVTAWAAQPPRVAETRAPAGSSLKLIEAIRDGDDARALALIEAGADVNGRWLGDGTPLIAAARHGKLELAGMLVARGADVNLACHGDGNPLIMAAASGDLDMVRFLVERGADVNAIVPSDETPLINAARQGSLPVARYLVEHGADPSLAVIAPTVAGQERRSPLGQAIRHGHTDLAAWLRSIGAKP